MTKNIVAFLICLTLFTSISAQDRIQLSTAEKVADFDSLYHTLQAVYPYFGVNKRLNSVDWLGNYDEYKTRVAETKNDKEFLCAIDSIMAELNCGHADLFPTERYNYYYKRYKIASWVFKAYKPYIAELRKNDAKKKCKHWQKIYGELYPKREAGGNLVDKKKSNITFQFNDSCSTAVLQIKSFLYEYIKRDKKDIIAFYNKLGAYNNLIIDIQDNGGGDTRYWQSVLVPYLTDSIMSYSYYMAFKNTAGYYKFAGGFEQSSLPVDSVALENLPEETTTGDYLFTKTVAYVGTNKKSVHYTGNIYVLVNHNVYSSSEAFAYFCKSSGFAQVAGESTGGDGIGTDPFLYTLPNSGIVIRHPGIMGLNSDGSSNEEKGTKPDIVLEGTSPREKLDNLKKHIQDSNL